MSNPHRFAVRHRFLATAAAAALASCPFMLHAAEKGWFGVAMSCSRSKALQWRAPRPIRSRPPFRKRSEKRCGSRSSTGRMYRAKSR